MGGWWEGSDGGGTGDRGGNGRVPVALIKTKTCVWMKRERATSSQPGRSNMRSHRHGKERALSILYVDEIPLVLFYLA
jgi:hypothetical protein